jgi:hypothetical protein
VHFEGILSGPVAPSPGIYFVTPPAGFFDVAGYLRGQQAAGVPTDLSVLVATTAVPEPSSLALSAAGILFTLAGLLRRRRR